MSYRHCQRLRSCWHCSVAIAHPKVRRLPEARHAQRLQRLLQRTVLQPCMPEKPLGRAQGIVQGAAAEVPQQACAAVAAKDSTATIPGALKLDAGGTESRAKSERRKRPRRWRFRTENVVEVHVSPELATGDYLRHQRHVGVDGVMKLVLGLS
eukprot:gene11592-29047_t